MYCSTGHAALKMNLFNSIILYIVAIGFERQTNRPVGLLTSRAVFISVSLYQDAAQNRNIRNNGRKQEGQQDRAAAPKQKVGEKCCVLQKHLGKHI